MSGSKDTSITLTTLDSKLESIRNENRATLSNLEIMYNELSAKMDILMNIDRQASSTTSGSLDTTTKRTITRPAFFKQIFRTERERYLDILYTQDMIDQYMKNEDVMKKKDETDKSNKIALSIYTDHIKVDKEKLSKFEEIYEQYKSKQ